MQNKKLYILNKGHEYTEVGIVGKEREKICERRAFQFFSTKCLMLEKGLGRKIIRKTTFRKVDYSSLPEKTNLDIAVSILLTFVHKLEQL